MGIGERGGGGKLIDPGRGQSWKGTMQGCVCFNFVSAGGPQGPN